MLLREQLVKFFQDHSIELESEKSLSQNEIDNIILNSSKYGIAFTSFLVWSVFNLNRNGLYTCFSSWDELYNSYCYFMSGFSASVFN